MTTPLEPAIVRIGLGDDLHRLQAGGRLVLGGVPIESPVGTIAHSDGDVVLHALTDALLGAAAQPDIGDLFPDTDPANKNADSRRFVDAAVRRLADIGLRPAQTDIVILLERPKLAPYKDAIRASVAALLGISADRVGVKAKTSEGVGPVGEGVAVAARVIVGLTQTTNTTD